MATSVKAERVERIQISPPKMRTALFRIVGTAPLVQHAFGEKAKTQMHNTQAAGSTAKKGAKREAKNFDQCFKDAQHVAEEGWNGIPASSFRAAMVRACTLVNFKMTVAKMALFVVADGFAKDGYPLVKITKGKAEYHESYARNDNGSIDLRARPMFREGWEADVRVRFDADMFTLSDVANLLARAGEQVGVGEGRPSSPNSCGMGWGTFSIAKQSEEEAK